MSAGLATLGALGGGGWGAGMLRSLPFPAVRGRPRSLAGGSITPTLSDPALLPPSSFPHRGPGMTLSPAHHDPGSLAPLRVPNLITAASPFALRGDTVTGPKDEGTCIFAGGLVLPTTGLG